MINRKKFNAQIDGFIKRFEQLKNYKPKRKFGEAVCWNCGKETFDWGYLPLRSYYVEICYDCMERYEYEELYFKFFRWLHPETELPEDIKAFSQREKEKEKLLIKLLGEGKRNHREIREMLIKKGLLEE